MTGDVQNDCKRFAILKTYEQIGDMIAPNPTDIDEGFWTFFISLGNFENNQLAECAGLPVVKLRRLCSCIITDLNWYCVSVRVNTLLMLVKRFVISDFKLAFFTYPEITI